MRNVKLKEMINHTPDNFLRYFDAVLQQIEFDVYHLNQQLL